MKAEEQIDSTLGLLGNVEPPPGLEARVRARLAAPSRRRSSIIERISLLAIAATIAVAAAALNPMLRGFATRTLTLGGRWGAPAVNVRHSSGSFGPASAVHVPVTPLPVAPTPVTQGRGHSRSEHRVPSQASRAPLPKGIAIPAEANMPAPQWTSSRSPR